MERELDIQRHIEIITSFYQDVFQGHHFFENILQKWATVLEHSSPVVRKPAVAQLNYQKEQKTEHVVETYQHITDFYDEHFFLFEWDIVLAFKWIQKHHIQPEGFVVHKWLPFVHQEHISFTNKVNQNPHLPVIGIDSIFEGKDCKTILNGNHRLVEAFQKGQSAVRGYYVRGTEHTQWMTSDLMRDFYEFLWDIKQMDNIFLTGSSFSEKDVYHQLLISKRV